MKPPHAYTRRILVAVTGLSPQIVTETVYALARREPSFVPTGIRVITTREGAERAELELLHPESGWFRRLRADYGLPFIEFRPEHIQVLADTGGQPLGDIRSPDDNTRAADTITELIRDLTRDDDSSLHVSIAGGRKTMGFYLGYALSLFGREQDRLSHVLVNPPYESHPQFFYPTPKSQVIYTLPPNNRPYDTRDGQVTLAEIPFVRLRDGLDRELLDGTASFSSVVDAAQRTVPPVALKLDPSRCTVIAGGESIRLQPSKFAFYWMLAERARCAHPGVHWSEAGIEQELLDYYGRVENPHSGKYERSEQAFARGLTEDSFNPAKAHVKQALRQRLGARIAAPYLIQRLERIPGTRYHRYGLTLPPEAIRIAPGNLGDAARPGSTPAATLRTWPERPNADTVKART